MSVHIGWYIAGAVAVVGVTAVVVIAVKGKNEESTDRRLTDAPPTPAPPAPAVNTEAEVARGVNTLLDRGADIARDILRSDREEAAENRRRTDCNRAGGDFVDGHCVNVGSRSNQQTNGRGGASAQG